MTIWLISDTHFFHKNIPFYTGRPLSHEELIWENLKIIEPDDTLIHVGDVAFRQTANQAREVFDRLPGGKKYLVKGNHDKKSKILKCPWTGVCEELELFHKSRRVFVRHRPNKHYIKKRMGFLQYAKEKIKSIIKPESPFPKDYEIIIHGHIHERGQFMRWENNQLIVNMCVEQTFYRPISMDFIVDEYNKRRDYEFNRKERNNNGKETEKIN